MGTKGIGIKFFIGFLVLILTAFSFSMVRCAYSASWGVKIAYSLEDVYNFLNGEGVYTKSVPDARISYTRIGFTRKFTILFKDGPSSGGWGWKLATSPTDAINFLNTVPPYTNLIKRTAVAGEWTGYHKEFYIFYQVGEPEGKPWRCMMTANYYSIPTFLNNAAANARILSMDIDGTSQYYIFYQPLSSPLLDHRKMWRLYSTDSIATVASWINHADDGDIGSIYKSSDKDYNVLLRFDD